MRGRHADWAELRHATGVMAVVLGVGFAIERLMMPDPPVPVVQARVNTCNGRWALMWLLGFGGTAAMALSGRPQTFFQVFALLTMTWEIWGLLARTFWLEVAAGPRRPTTPARRMDEVVAKIVPASQPVDTANFL